MPTEKLTSRFSKAVADANEMHKNQTRKGGTIKVPYMCHLLQVAGIVIEYGGSEDEAIAAIFHDSIEDVGNTYEWLKENYGENVANIVQGCTHEKIDKSLPKEQWPALIKEKRLKTFEEFRHASESVLRVAAADKLHNLRSLLKDLREQGENAFNAFKGGKAGTLFYFYELLAIFRESKVTAVNQIATEIRFIYDEVSSGKFNLDLEAAQ